MHAIDTDGWVACGISRISGTGWKRFKALFARGATEGERAAAVVVLERLQSRINVNTLHADLDQPSITVCAYDLATFYPNETGRTRAPN